MVDRYCFSDLFSNDSLLSQILYIEKILRHKLDVEKVFYHVSSKKKLNIGVGFIKIDIQLHVYF